jgi:hypothetical protein
MDRAGPERPDLPFSARTSRSERIIRQRPLHRLRLVTRGTLPKRHRRNELRVISVFEFLIPTHQVAGDLMGRVSAEVEAIREMARCGEIHGFLGDILHAPRLLHIRLGVKLCLVGPPKSQMAERASWVRCDDPLFLLPIGGE